jgi:hypothetical protein
MSRRDGRKELQKIANQNNNTISPPRVHPSKIGDGEEDLAPI